MKKKMRIYSMLAILGLILVVSGTSYAVLSLILEGTVDNVLRLGNLSLVLDESNVITLSNALPISDEEGLLSDAYSFSVENDGTIESGYKIYLDDDVIEVGENRIPSSNIRYELRVDGSQDTVANLSDDSTELYVSNIAPGVVVNFELRIWVDYDVTSIQPNTVHTSKLRIEASQILNVPQPNTPELVGDMIPVIYDGTNWVKADTLTEWYNYDNQEWANAVTVTETNRATLVSSAVGTVIPMDDINAMFVWIPRYSYTIGNTYGYQGYGGDMPSINTPGAFDIKWVKSNVTDTGTAAYTGDTASEWYTNPAFCWGDSCDDLATRANSENRELPGIWVAKFESSTTDEICTTYPSPDCNKILQPIVKPSVMNWTHINVSVMFESVQTYMNGSNGETIFGLNGTTYDTHMMKNTEWGAVAYLSQSKYGKYGNLDYSGVNKEIAINASNLMTGMGSGTDSVTNTYETPNGQAASTTGNIYGIYDMSGGSPEEVMANMVDSSGNFNSQGASFSSVPEAKYYNSYNYENDYTNSMLGDGIKETAKFYGDSANYMKDNSGTVWLQRGGSSYLNSIIGIFNFNASLGFGATDYSYYTFRITLIN